MAKLQKHEIPYGFFQWDWVTDDLHTFISGPPHRIWSAPMRNALGNFLFDNCKYAGPIYRHYDHIFDTKGAGFLQRRTFMYWRIKARRALKKHG